MNGNDPNGFWKSEPQKPITENQANVSNVENSPLQQSADNFVNPVQPANADTESIAEQKNEVQNIPTVPFESEQEQINPEIPNFSGNNSAQGSTPFNPVFGTNNQNVGQAVPNSGYVDYSHPVYSQEYRQTTSPAQDCNMPQYNQAQPMGYGFNPQNFNGGAKPNQGFNPINGYTGFNANAYNAGAPMPNAADPSAQPYMPYQPYPNPMVSPQKKSNGGLIAIIIVLSVLLAGSAIGLIIGSINKNSNISQDNFGGNNQYGYTMPDFGIAPQETTPQKEHKESDYSSKADPDYKGLTLLPKPNDAATNKSYNSEYAYSKVSDSVVGIVCYSDKVTSVENCQSQGSGIIVSSDGYIVTNAHVINNSKTAYIIQVITADGKTYDAGVVGFDTRTDIAVLKIDGNKNLKPASFGNSDNIVLGEDIIVVGNPGGLDYQNSITKGVVSAVNRKLSSTSLVKYIQTDAAINPGNSGGPIVNLYGQVIGIATSKIVSEKYEGMGFAIPTATAKDIIDNLIRYGYVKGRVKIGISGTAVDSATASASNVPQGILIQEIIKGGPCDNTELAAGDIITEADGKEVTSFSDIYAILEEHKAGDKITLKYYRTSDGSSGSVKVTLQEDK